MLLTEEIVESALLDVDSVTLFEIFDASSLPVVLFVERYLVPVLDRIGARWQDGELSLAQVYMSGRIVEKLIDEKRDVASQSESGGENIGLAVLEDFHVLGKRIVASVLVANGFRFKDYGPVALSELVHHVEDDKIRFLLISTLMLSSALKIRQLKDELDKRGLSVKIIAGGAPFRFDPILWHEVGADATSSSASGVALILNNMIKGVEHV